MKGIGCWTVFNVITIVCLWLRLLNGVLGAFCAGPMPIWAITISALGTALLYAPEAELELSELHEHLRIPFLGTLLYCGIMFVLVWEGRWLTVITMAQLIAMCDLYEMVKSSRSQTEAKQPNG